MDKKIQHIKVGIVIAQQKELLMSVNGERLHDYEAYFSDKFLEPIYSSIKTERWGVWFKQDDESIPSFIVDIYTDTHDDYVLIRRLIITYMDADPKLTIMAPYWNFDRFIEETT